MLIAVMVILLIAVIGLGALIVTHLGHTSTNPTPAASATARPTARPVTPAPAIAAPLVVAFTDPAGHFSARFPVTPVRQTSAVPGTNGAVNSVVWESQASRSAQYLVEYTTYPPADTPTDAHAALDRTAQVVATGAGGTVISEQFGTLQGLVSSSVFLQGLVRVDFIVSTQGTFLDGRAVLGTNTLYIMAVSGVDDPPAGFDAFVNSVHINP